MPNRLDGQTDDYARILPGFEGVEKWVAREGGAVHPSPTWLTWISSVRLPQHHQAKGQVHRWYAGYRIVVSEVSATHGHGRLSLSDQVAVGFRPRRPREPG